MKRWFVWAGSAVCFCVFAAGLAKGQVVTQHAHEVYGGRITDITVAKPAAMTNFTRVFAATESANSVFYADINHSGTNRNEIFGKFSVVPDFDANANFGIVNSIAVHEPSAQLYIAHNSGLYSAGTNAGSITTNIAAHTGVHALHIRGDHLFAIGGIQEDRQLHFGTLDSKGALSEHADSPLSIGAGSSFVPATHPTSPGPLYLLDRHNRAIIVSSDNYDSISDSTVVDHVPLPDFTTNWLENIAFGIAPNTNMYIGSANATNKVVAYSEDGGTTWEKVETGRAGVGGSNIEFVESGHGFYMYFGAAMSTNMGKADSWTGIPRGGSRESHPNDGPVKVDLLDSRVIYLTTDQGLGSTTNACIDIFGIDNGIAAVQIQDFDMNTGKTVAWTASKSGVRVSTNFTMESPVWSDAIFPNDDGAPYYAVNVNKYFEDGSYAYVGNLRVYKTDDFGQTWDRILSLEDEGLTESFVSTIESFAGEVLFAGSHKHNQQSSERGALFMSPHGGIPGTWEKHELQAGGVNINDILAPEGGEGILAYVAAAYDADTGTGGGVFRYTDTVVTHVLPDPVTLRSLAMDAEGGIYASGMDTNNAPVVYYKAPDIETWVPVTTQGLPESAMPLGSHASWRGPPMTVGKDADDNEVLYIAIGTRLYFLHTASSAGWRTSEELKYPEGTHINVLYWDDLVVGTDIGIYSQPAPEADDLALVPAYRFYSYGAPESTHTHLWTINEAERDALMAWPSWMYEGVGWYALTNAEPGSTPLYRLYEPNIQRHLYTISPTEYLALTNTSWNGEGVQYFVYPTNSVSGAIPAYRFYHSANQNHHFTIDENEKNTIIAMPEWGYTYEGVAFYVFVTNVPPSLRQGVVVPDAKPAVIRKPDVFANSSPQDLNIAQDVEAVPGDYNGDGVADSVVYDEITGRWYISSGAGHVIWGEQWGGPGMVAVEGDYNGNGLADMAVYDLNTGKWYIRTVSGNIVAWGEQWGGPGFVPVPMDYDGDGISDLAVYHKETGLLYVATLDGKILAWALEPEGLHDRK